MPHDKKVETEIIIELYAQGYSCEKIAAMHSMTRQSVWERLRRKNINLRSKIILPFIIYDGIKFTPSDNGYYRATSRKKHVSLHRYKYMKEVGKIPDGYDIHHKDGNKQNNKIENLECILKSEHTKRYSPHHNQHVNNKTKGIKK